MIPNNSFTTTPVAGNIAAPKGRVKKALEAFTYGPVAVSDTSQGLLYQPWTGSFGDLGEVIMTGNNGATATPVTDIDIEDFDISFNQNGDTFVAFEKAGDLYINWFDPNPNTYVTTLISAGEQPFCVMDFIADEYIADSDIILIYKRGTGVYYRYQRDRFLIEYTAPVTVTGQDRILRAGLTDQVRLQIEVGFRNF